MKFSSVLLVLVLLIAVVLLIHRFSSQLSSPPHTQVSQTNQQTAVPGARTKTSGCQVQGPLQDMGCTPGAINPNLTKDVLCSPTFSTKSVRNVPSEEKRQVYNEYGIFSHKPGQYEVDHLISLELGGSNDIANLWPEAADPRPGFHEKDQVENYLHDQVCREAISLQQAQQEISSNWLSVYQSMPH